MAILDPYLADARVPNGRPLHIGPGVSLPEQSASIAPGYVRLTVVADGEARSLDLYTRSEPYMLSDGYAAGWDLIPRPQRISATVWRSGAPLRQVIPVTLDVFGADGLDVEDEWRALEQLARPPRGRRPPVIKVAGPVQHPGQRWVISELEPDDASIERVGRRIVRIDADVTLMQWVPAELADDDPLPRNQRPAAPGTATVRAGESIRDVARRAMKTYPGRLPHKALRLARANGRTDPAYKPRAGTQLRLPARG